MPENNLSLAEIHGQDYLAHKKAHGVHRKTGRTHSEPSNPLIGYLEQEQRKLLAPIHGDKKVTQGKLAKGITALAEQDYNTRMDFQKGREDDQAKIRAGERDVLIKEAFNRARFLESVNNQISIDTRLRHDKKEVRPTSMLFEDIDRFKLINDTYDHAFGDLMLKVVGRVNAESIRATDAFGRYGGEELLKMLRETDTLGAIHAAMRIQENFHKVLLNPQQAGMPDLFPEGYHHPEGFNPYQTISFGLSMLKEGQTDTDFIKASDAAMYQAKKVRHKEQALGIQGEGAKGKIAINTGETIYVINTDPRLIADELKKLDLTDEKALDEWLSISVGQSPDGFKTGQEYISRLQRRSGSMRGAVKFMLKSNTASDVIKTELTNYLKLPKIA